MPDVSGERSKKMTRFIQTPQEFNDAIVIGATCETVCLEFKQALNGFGRGVPAKERNKAQLELCCDIAQFANTRGGCLLIGVAEENSVASEIRPIENSAQVKQWVDQAVTEHLVPSTLTYHFDEISTSKGAVVAINVPASVALVAVWDRGTGQIFYVRRSHHGKAFMNPDEAERHRMNASRATMLTLRAIKAKAEGNSAVDIADGLWVHAASSNRLMATRAPVLLKNIGEDVLELEILPNGGYHLLLPIPYGVIKSAWLTPSKTIGLLLDVLVLLPSPINSGDARIVHRDFAKFA